MSEQWSDIAWAHNLLGLASSKWQPARTLYEEVDAYLLDSVRGTSILAYWQVSYGLVLYHGDMPEPQ